MKETIKQLLIIIGAGIIVFYAVPYWSNQVTSSSSGMLLFMAVLYIVNPIYSFVSGMVFAKHNGFKWYLPVIIGALFTPAVYIYYNGSASIYIAIYAVMSAIGSALGLVIRRRSLLDQIDAKVNNR